MRRKQITYSSRPSHAARQAHARGDRQFRNYDTSHIQPKKSKGPLIVGIVIAVVALIAITVGIFAFMNNEGDLLRQDESVEVTIPEGATAGEIGTLLQENKVIGNSKKFTSRVSELSIENQLKPGVYTFSGGMTLDQVIDTIREGFVDMGDALTVPEGYTLEQIADRVAKVYPDKITKDDFLKLAKDAKAYEADYPFVADAYDNKLEGFLFPKTYKLEDEATADSVIRQMLDQYKSETDTVDYSFSASKNLTPYEVLVIASMIEREATLAEEQPTVSSVIYNRLNQDMRMQIDATVAYAVGSTNITVDDLKVDSPYNTYENDGIPPGPICSPGLSAIKAAADPEETKYLYYVVTGKGDGTHNFAETYEEHETNVANSNNA